MRRFPCFHLPSRASLGSQARRVWGVAAWSLLLGGSGLLSFPALADEKEKATPTPPKAESPVAEEVKTGDYVIGVDDVIAVYAIGREELNGVYQVLSTGKLTVAGIKEDLQAEGVTLGQLRDTLYKKLSRLYRNLELSVSVRESRSRNVSLIGARGSGVFPLRKGMRVSTLIAQAGGLAGKPKLTDGMLIRTKGRSITRIKLDIPKLISPDVEAETDPLLEPNDLITLDTREEPTLPSFSISGAVAKSGNSSLPKDGVPVSLMQAIAMSGGPAPIAALNSAVLIRKGKTIPLKLAPLLLDGRVDIPEAKILMEDGDIIQIPEETAKFTVLGLVNRPGNYPLHAYKEYDILKAIGEAGGGAQGTMGAEMRDVRLVRTEEGKTTFFRLDVLRMMTRGELAKNMKLQNGDIIFIPQRGHKFEFQDILNPLFYLSYLGFRPFGR